MNGALAASPAEPRPAAPESASRRRPDAVVRAPVAEIAAPVVAAVPALAMRDRLHGALAAPDAPPLPEAAPAATSEAPLTTRDRIANRARETAEAAVVVPAAEVEARRQQRNAAAPLAAPVAGPPAVVVPLRPRAELEAPARDAPVTPARGPPAPASESATVPARESPAPVPTPVVVARVEPVAPASAESIPPGSPAAEPVAPAVPVAVAPIPAGPTPAAPGPAEAGAQTAQATAAPAAPTPAAPGPADAGAQRAQATAAPAAPKSAQAPASETTPVPAAAAEESRVDAFRARADAAARRAKHHRPADKAAANAQAASAPNPDLDVGRQVAEEQVDAMGTAQPGRFDPATFKASLQQAIDGMAPPASEEEAEDVEKSTDPGPARGQIHDVVASGRDAAESDIKTTTDAPPDRGGKVAKKPGELVNDPAHPAMPPIGAADAMPAPMPESATDFSAATGEIDVKMQQNGLTQEQLAESNEPSFTAVLDARDAARANAAQVPGAYRAHEDVVLATARGDADAVAAPQITGMRTQRGAVLARVLDEKHKTGESDAQQRDMVNQAILDIHKRTRDDVHGMLDALDKKVETMFTAYEESARADFEADVGLKMQNYKDERYSGLSGLYHGARDYVRGLPKEVDKFYADGRAKYLRSMERALEKLANLIVSGLFMAHLRILVGRAQVKTYVEETLPQSLRQLGRETADKLDHNFDTLESDIDSKRDELVQTIAKKYVDARGALDTRIEELKAENRGLIDKVIDATIGVAKTIYELGKMLLRVLIKAAEAIGDIVAHPIRFLGNLIDAVGGGLQRFIDRIGVHLQEALLDLLFGELGSKGITMPSALDFAGIVDLVLQVLGLTYSRIRERAVRHFGEPVVSRLEQTVDIFTTLVKEGVAGLWQLIKEKLSDLEDLVIGKIKEYIIERVVTAGINYILALLTPVGAFIKACQTIYKIVMFIVEKAKEIADFVDSILDSISAIAAGDVATAVLKVEGALAGALKIAIKFLAELVNLGSLAEKVRSIIDLIRTPVTKIVDAIIFGAAEVYRKTLAFVEGKVVPRRDEYGKEIAKKEIKPHEIDVAKHAEPAAKPLPLEHPAIHEPFTVAGERHEITDDGTGMLVVASDGVQPVAGISELAVLNQRYRALPDTAPQVRRTEILEEMIALLKQHPGLIVHARAQLHDPPNLGEVNRHRTNSGLAFRPETRTHEPQFAPLWEMESEHVLSVAAVGATFQGIGLGSQIERPSDEDAHMHTVMLYMGAAHSKTYGPEADHRLIERHEGELRGVRRELDRLRWDPRHAGNIELVLRELLGDLYDWGLGAVRRTKDAVLEEQRENAVHRGRHPNDPPIPTDSKIEDAYRLQIQDVGELAHRRYEAQQ